MSIDYTSYSNDDIYNEPVVEASYEEVIVEEESEKELQMGKIANAEKVYLRSEPEVRNGNDVKVLDNGTDVLISDISDEWYKICTESGLEGYVMKKFVDIS